MTTRDGTPVRRTTSGKIGFRTSRMGFRVSRDDAPPVASARSYLRANLPAIYQDGDFGVRFVGGLETLLDPIVGALDSLPHYFHPELAPRDVLEVLAAWLGLELEESWPDERCRHALRLAGELCRRRGTKSGLELMLGIAFPELPLRVEDGGTVSIGQNGGNKAGSFVVYCDVPLGEPEQAAVARFVDRAKPVHISYKLRVKTPRRSTQGKTQ